MGKPLYKVFAIMSGRIEEKNFRGAPTEAQIYNWAKPLGAHFSVRYYPRYHGWRVLDLRNAQSVSVSGGWRWRVMGIERLRRTWPNSDPAVMWALAKASAS